MVVLSFFMSMVMLVVCFGTFSKVQLVEVNIDPLSFKILFHDLLAFSIVYIDPDYLLNGVFLVTNA
jgi:hypothetical protein